MLLNVELGNPVPAGHSSLSLGLPSIVCTWILSIDGLPSLLSQFGPDRQAGLFWPALRDQQHIRGDVVDFESAPTKCSRPRKAAKAPICT
jgi:hypothetical protein